MANQTPMKGKDEKGMSTLKKNDSSFIKEKTKVVKKGYTELKNLILAQEINCGNDAIWVIKFRHDG
jgi:uncharacterized membrane protein